MNRISIFYLILITCISSLLIGATGCGGPETQNNGTSDVAQSTQQGDACKNYCANGGTCALKDGTPTCTCKPGYKGDKCEEVGSCEEAGHASYCANGGTCTLKNGSPTCTCKPGYKGDKCEEVGSCEEAGHAMYCANNGTCTLKDGSPSCTCKPGYKGEKCDEVVSCEEAGHGTYCANGGTCTLKDGSPSCTCKPGYKGEKCEEVGSCEEAGHAMYCANGGTCALKDGAPTCTCKSGYKGDKCEKERDPASFTIKIRIPEESKTDPTWNKFEIRRHPSALNAYDYIVSCGNGTIPQSHVTDDHMCTYAAPGEYTINITGKFPGANFGEMSSGKPNPYKDKLIAVVDWGTLVKFKTFFAAFRKCTNLKSLPELPPDLSQLENIEYMFDGASSLNASLKNWNFPKVFSLNSMFKDATSFNGSLEGWNTSHIGTFKSMFEGAEAFNQDLSHFDVSSGQFFQSMFKGAKAFNKDISGWKFKSFASSFLGWIGNSMFEGADSFNQDLSSWTVDKIESCQDFAKDTPAWTKSKPSFYSQCVP